MTELQEGVRPIAAAPATVADVMQHAVISAYPGALFREIALALERGRLELVPVVDLAHRVLGVVTPADLLARIDCPATQGACTAERMMTAPAVTVRPTTPIGEAAELLRRERVRAMPVIDRDGVLVGVVGATDLLTVFTCGPADRRDEPRLAG